MPLESIARRAAALALLIAAARAQAPADALAALVDDPHLRAAHVGVAVLDLESGAVLAARDEHRAFLPASTLKLVTLAVVLHTLPADFRFRTSLVARGEIRDGVLHGDLVLVGSGDPSFGGRLDEDGPRATLDRFATVLQDRGITRITGDVIGDGTIQRDASLPAGWSIEDEAADYAAPPAGLCFADNCITVVAGSGSRDKTKLHVELSPPTDFVTVACTATSGPKDAPSSFAVTRAHGSNRIDVTGTLPLGAEPTQRVAVAEPVRYAAHVLREQLLRRGIAVLGAARDAADLPTPTADAPSVELHQRLSPPLAALLAEIGKHSNNLYAEQLWRAAARAAGGDPAAHTARVLGELGIDMTGMVTADGSGLSRLDLVTPHQLVTLLGTMARSPHYDAFIASLAGAAGPDGTLAKRLLDVAGLVLAKTGTMTRASALSGYVQRAGERRPLAFAVLLNGFSCSTAEAEAAIDAFVTALVSYAETR